MKSLYVDVGDQVRKGQLIVELVNPESDPRWRQAGASVTAAEAGSARPPRVPFSSCRKTDAEIARPRRRYDPRNHAFGRPISWRKLPS